MCVVSHGERTVDGAQFAGQCEFTGEFIVDKIIARNLSGSGEYPQRDRQVEASAFLGQISGSQVHGNAARGKVETAIQQPERTRSLLSFTSASGSPTMVKLGRPLARCTSTVTGGASMPASARLYRTARDTGL